MKIQFMIRTIDKNRLTALTSVQQTAALCYFCCKSEKLFSDTFDVVRYLISL